MHDFCSRYGFHTTPYTREFQTARRFRHPCHDEAQEALRATIEQRQSAALIAPAGTGKTSLLRALVDDLPEARYRIHYVMVNNLVKRDMCREVAMAAGVKSAGCFPALVRNLQDRFLHLVESDAVRPVLIFDDAHEFRPEVLGILKILTNFEMDSRLVVSILLVGQNPLRHLLRREELEDVARRLAHYATLRNLSREETWDYLEHRATDAGATQVPFDASAGDAIFEIARGNLRAIDKLALKALQLAHDADRDVVDPSLIVAARKVLWP
jgi:general secretion pathway protein A